MATTPSSLLAALIVAGLLGMLGQAVRAIGGFKKLSDCAASLDVSPTDLFVASRLVISLLVGFLAGVAAGFMLGLDQLAGLNGASVQTLLGIAAAGYAGTDFLESFAPILAGGPPPSGVKVNQGDGRSGTSDANTTTNPAALPGDGNGAADKQSNNDQASGSGTPADDGDDQTKIGQTPSPVSPSHGSEVLETRAVVKAGGSSPIQATFGTLVSGGFFSANPDDGNIKRSIRTNNPGALNFTAWQARRPGYVGVTQPDASPNHNVTTIYRTPEHGVAAWYNLLSKRYGFSSGEFTLKLLAEKYAGTGDISAIEPYLTGWTKWLSDPLSTDDKIQLSDVAMMTVVGKAMFSHEAGVRTPLEDVQISYGIRNEIAGTLPA